MTFHIYHGEQLVRSEQLAQDIVKVGKLPSSHLRIDDDNVSRMHAVIEVTSPEEIYIIDLGSSSGTIVNGKKVNKCQIQNGDEIQLGETRVVVEIEAAADEEPTEVSAGAPAAQAQQAGAAPPPPPTPGAAPPPPVPGGGGQGGAALPNPFAAPAQGAAGGQSGQGGASAEDPDRVQYGIVASGPPVPSEEVETNEQAIEVMIMWGDKSVLHVEHLNPPRPFYVGEPSGEKKGKKSKDDPDYLMGSEVLGAQRMPVVTQSGGGVAVVVPEGATGEVTVGEQTMSIADLQNQGKLQACSEFPGAQQYPLPAGATAKVQFKGFQFIVKPTQAGRRVATGFSVDWRPLVYIGGSLAVFSIFLIMFYFAPPRGSALNLDLLNKDSRLVKYLMEAEEVKKEETPDWLKKSKSKDKEGGKGKRHKGEEGKMGKEKSKKTNNKYAIKGPEDNQDPQMAKEKAKKMAENAGIVGTLKSMSGSWNSPTSPYGAEKALGNDAMSAMGGLMGDQAGSNFGFGGLGMSGTGRGGGGTGEGTIGLGNMGTIGHGGGGGEGSGYGRGAGGFHGRSSKVPEIKSGAADVRGSLSKEVIRRVIRRHLNEVKFCYEQQLNQRPDLSGRVKVKFIISPSGAVQSAVVSGSTLGNQKAETCIAQAVRRWTFPKPEGGGIVVVNYPFMLRQSG
jgi:TonB family protein